MSSESETSPAQTPTPQSGPTGVPQGRFSLLVVTWIVALAMASPDPRGIVMLPYFPLGLVKVFSSKPEGSEGAVVLGWAVYLVLSFFVFLTHRKVWFYLVYAVLVVMLLTNAMGCHMIMKDMSRVH